jgi:hypothetical protein
LSIDGIIFNRKELDTKLPHATLETTNPSWTTLGMNPDLYSYGTA